MFGSAIVGGDGSVTPGGPGGEGSDGATGSCGSGSKSRRFGSAIVGGEGRLQPMVRRIAGQSLP